MFDARGNAEASRIRSFEFAKLPRKAQPATSKGIQKMHIHVICTFSICMYNILYTHLSSFIYKYPRKQLQ